MLHSNASKKVIDLLTVDQSQDKLEMVVKLKLFVNALVFELTYTFLLTQN